MNPKDPWNSPANSHTLTHPWAITHSRPVSRPHRADVELMWSTSAYISLHVQCIAHISAGTTSLETFHHVVWTPKDQPSSPRTSGAGRMVMGSNGKPHCMTAARGSLSALHTPCGGIMFGDFPCPFHLHHGYWSCWAELWGFSRHG